MRGSAAFRAAIAPGGALAGPWVKNPLWRTARAVPSLDLQFADTKSLADAVTGQSLVTFTRASSGTYVGSDGLIKTATTNLVTFSQTLNNAAWILTGTNATLTATTDIAAPNGSMTAWTLTCGSGGFAQIQQTYTGISGVSYTGSFWVRRRSGTNTVAIRVSENTNTTLVGVTSDWQRFSFTATSTTTTIRLGINLIGTTDAVDIWGAQLEQSSTVGEYIPTTSTINSAPRFDHNPTTGESLGLLVEEQRTNWIRNNTMVGAVAGTPGTLPTNWIGAGSSGLAREVTGVGTESGIAYVDVRYFGTTTSALFQNVAFEVSNQIAAAQSSIWTSTAFVKLVGGSLANITSAKLVIDSYNSSNVSLGQYAIGNFVPTTAALVTQRYSVSSTSSTFSNAATAFVRPYLQFEANSGVAIDITLRIGLPQLEQGAFATSVIPTTTAAATRSADVASITGTAFSSWYRQDEGTVFASLAVGQPASGGNQFVFRFSDNTYQNAVAMNVESSGFMQISTASSNVFDGLASATTGLSSGVLGRFAEAYATNNLGVSFNGGSPVGDTSATMPTALTRADIGSDHAGSNRMKAGTIRRLTYWPQRLPNSTLQALTQ